MKKKRLAVLYLLGALTLGGLTIGSLAGCYSDENITESATFTLVYNQDYATVSVILVSSGETVSEGDSLEEGDVIRITISLRDGYQVTSVNGTSGNATTWDITLSGGENTIEIVIQEIGASEGDGEEEETSLGFTVDSTIFLDLDEDADGVALSEFVTWDEGVTPYSLDLDYDEENEIFSFDGEYITPLSEGTVTDVKVYRASDGYVTEDNYVTTQIVVTSQTTDFEKFNIAGKFETTSSITSYFDNSGSQNFNMMTIGDTTASYIEDDYFLNLWVTDDLTNSEDWPLLNLKATLVTGIEANTTYTVTFNFDYGGFNNIYLKVNGETITPSSGSYSGSYRTYYHTFTTPEDISEGVEIELNISYEGETAPDSLWGHLGNYQIAEGNTVPVEETRTNYIRDGGFEYPDPSTSAYIGDSYTWIVTGDSSAITYASEWGAIDGNLLKYSSDTVTDLVTYSQTFEVSDTTEYYFEYSMTISSNTDDEGVNGEYFDTLEIVISDGETQILAVGKDHEYGLSYGPTIQTVEGIELEAGKEYTVSINFDAKENDGSFTSYYPYAAIDSLGIYHEGDDQVTIDGLHHVTVGQEITLDSNYEGAEWSVDNENVSIAPSEDGSSCIITGVSEGTTTITATANGTTCTHDITIESAYEVQEDTAYIKDGSFEQSGAAGELLSDFWVESGATPDTHTTVMTNVSEGSYSFSFWFENASEENYILSQANTFQVESSGTYELSYSLMGSGFTVSVQITDSENNIVSSSSSYYSGHTDDVSSRYHSFTLDLEVEEDYQFSIVVSDIGADAWFALDDISLDTYITPVEISGETTIYEGNSTILTSNKAVSWEIIDGSEYGLLSEDSETSTTFTANEDSGNQSVTIQATSTAEGEEDNIATHTINILERSSDGLSLSADKTELYDGSTVALTASDDVTYSLSIDEGYTQSGDSFTFDLGLAYGETEIVTITAQSESGATAEVTVTIYSSEITNNGEFNVDESLMLEGYENEWDVASYGRTVGGESASKETNRWFWLDGNGCAQYSESFENSEDYIDLCLYWEFEVIEDTTFYFEVLYNNSYPWGPVQILNSSGESIIDDIWNGETQTGTVELEAGETYQFGWFVAEDGMYAGYNDAWVATYTLNLTAGN